ncbi:type II toxin-antitoxin system RatA family toxin [Asticcacaulis sp. AC402]|uniref:type II toxin-antitoxin system RatA family toxin n=1 Tax=Asticcacaulis sp. AC402 TaxID=1282361 RepID=UPI0003C3AFAC|nr:type II toxin-antitoxin system RatA family toxin [Asticcacaulis sp. AC402]ESQ75446.1 cyclase [Asticcacaulis sp. AC402]
MTKFHIERVLPYEAVKLWEMVGDVERYPDFIPWITRLHAYNHQQAGEGAARFDADVSVGFKMLQEKFSTRVTRNGPDMTVDMNLIRGPFKEMDGRWTFTAAEGGTRIDFDMDMAFKNPVLNALFKANFNIAVNRLIAIFEHRARQLYGENAA